MALCLSTALVLLTLPSLQSPQPSMASGSARTGAALPASLGTGGVSPSASWAYAPFGSHIGTSGLVVSEGLASPQLFLGGGLGPGGGSYFWHALTFNATTGGYDQVFVSPVYPAGIDSLAVGKVLPGAENQIIVALVDGSVLFLDERTKAQVGGFETQVSAFRDLFAYDLDQDGLDELLVVTSFGLHVFGPDGVLQWSLSGVGGDEVIAGQMDADASIEIATTEGYVVDAASQAVQWTHAPEFGSMLALVDQDGDGMEELIVGRTWNSIEAFDVDLQSLKWLLPTGNTTAMRVQDGDGDGIPDLLLGEGQFGSVVAYDLGSMTPKLSVPNPDHGVADLLFADLDLDGVAELVFAGGWSSSGADHLNVWDPVTGQVEWSSVDLGGIGALVGPLRGDLDGDGIDELVTCTRTSDAGYKSGRILVFDGTDMTLIGMSDPVGGSGSAWSVWDLALADLDSDGRDEILVPSKNVIASRVEVYDFDPSSGFTLHASKVMELSFEDLYLVDAADLDGDGVPEIVAGGSHLHVYDYSTGAVTWTSPDYVPSYVVLRDLRICDLDSDGVLEVIALDSSGSVHVYDATAQVEEATIAGSFEQLACTERDGVPYVFLADDQGDLLVHTNVAGSYPHVATIATGLGELDGFAFGPHDLMWFSVDGVQHMQYFGTGSSAWTSENYGAGLGEQTVLHRFGPLVGHVTAGQLGIMAFAW